MPPTPKRPNQRQRRNRTSSAATLEAAAAAKIRLPQRRSPWTCTAKIVVKDVDRQKCPLVGAMHELIVFLKQEVEPHEFKPKVIAWRPLTLRWWETIWASPMVDEWVDADVPGLLMLAALVDEFWSMGDSKIAAEVRMQSREYGLSPLSRRSLQWEIKRLETPGKPATSQPPPPTRHRGGRATLTALEGGKATV